MLRNRRAFTLTELMISVVLLGLVAGFGIPSYTKAREKADEKEAVHSVRMMGEAVKNYMIRNNGIFPPDAPEVNDINTTLNLGFIENTMDYRCLDLGIPALGYVCVGTNIRDGWEIGWASAPDVVVCVVGFGDCPSQVEGANYPDVF